MLISRVCRSYLTPFDFISIGQPWFTHGLEFSWQYYVTITTVKPSNPRPTTKESQLNKVLGWTHVNCRYVRSKTRGGWLSLVKGDPPDWRLGLCTASATVRNSDWQRVAQPMARKGVFVKFTALSFERDLFKPRRIGGRVCFLTFPTPLIQRPQQPQSSLSAAPSIRVRCLALTSTIMQASTLPLPLVRSSTGINSWTRHHPLKRSTTRCPAIR